MIILECTKCNSEKETTMNIKISEKEFIFTCNSCGDNLRKNKVEKLISEK